MVNPQIDILMATEMMQTAFQRGVEAGVHAALYEMHPIKKPFQISETTLEAFFKHRERLDNLRQQKLQKLRDKAVERLKTPNP